MKSELAAHVCLTEPKLSFHPERLSDRDIHPLEGLLRFGPYSSGLVPDPIRVATISPNGEGPRLFNFMKELHSPAKPAERRDYLPEWKGFHGVFGLHMKAASKSCHIELPSDFEREFQKSQAPHILLAETLVRAIQSLDGRRAEFDVLFIYIPKRWEPGYEGGPEEDFDLHDHLKAMTAARRLPVQLVREDKALAYPCRASVMWRIGLALYAKAGGIPWKLAETDAETAYIGISYYLDRTLRPLGIKAGVPDINFAMLRRTCATYFRDNLKSAQRQLRHKTPHVTAKHYQQSITAEHRSAVAKLDQELCNPEKKVVSIKRRA